jgi:hypothetical protein
MTEFATEVQEADAELQKLDGRSATPTNSLLRLNIVGKAHDARLQAQRESLFSHGSNNPVPRYPPTVFEDVRDSPLK